MFADALIAHEADHTAGTQNRKDTTDTKRAQDAVDAADREDRANTPDTQNRTSTANTEDTVGAPNTEDVAAQQARQASRLLFVHHTNALSKTTINAAASRPHWFGVLAAAHPNPTCFCCENLRPAGWFYDTPESHCTAVSIAEDGSAAKLTRV